MCTFLEEGEYASVSARRFAESAGAVQDTRPEIRKKTNWTRNAFCLSNLKKKKKKRKKGVSQLSVFTGKRSIFCTSICEKHFLPMPPRFFLFLRDMIVIAALLSLSSLLPRPLLLSFPLLSFFSLVPLSSSFTLLLCSAVVQCCRLRCRCGCLSVRWSSSVSVSSCPCGPCFLRVLGLCFSFVSRIGSCHSAWACDPDSGSGKSIRVCVSLCPCLCLACIPSLCIGVFFLSLVPSVSLFYL